MSLIARAKSVKGSIKAAKYKEQENKDSVFIFQENLHGDNPKERWENMKFISEINTRTEKKFVENVISPVKEVGDKFSLEDWKKLAIDYAEKMNYRENQWYAVLHQNTDEKHLHLIVNRIGFDRKNTINDSKIGERAGKVADQLARERGLVIAKDLGKEKRNKIKQAIINSSQRSHNWNEFINLMKDNGYLFELNYNNQGINGGRIIVLNEIEENQSRREILAKKGFKLSEIDRNLKVKEIEKTFINIKNTIQEKEEQSQQQIKFRR